MTNKQIFALFLGFFLIFLLISCLSYRNYETPTSTPTSLGVQTIQNNTGRFFLQKGEGVEIRFEIEPDAELADTWSIRLNLHIYEAQQRLRVSISSRSDTCTLKTTTEVQGLIPSEISTNTISWDFDSLPTQTIFLNLALSNCSIKNYGFIAELNANAMTQYTSIIYDYATIFNFEDHWQIVNYGTPWPTPTYDPLMPNTFENLEKEITPSWQTATPLITPAYSRETLVYELTSKAYQGFTPTLETSTPTQVVALATPTSTQGSAIQTPIPYP